MYGVSIKFGPSGPNLNAYKGGSEIKWEKQETSNINLSTA